MKKPDDWTIFSVFEGYNYLIKKNQEDYENDDINMTEYYSNQEEYRKLSIQAMRLIFTKEEFEYGDLMIFDVFIDCVIDGSFTPYDGVGYYVAFDGTELGAINWDNPEDYPKETAFIIWYNK